MNNSTQPLDLGAERADDELDTAAAEADALRAERDRLAETLAETTAELNRHAETLDDAVTELAAAEEECGRLRRIVHAKNFILWGELSMVRAKTEARTGRRLVGLMREYPDAERAFDVFHDTLTAAIDAKIAAEGEVTR